jgi:hypothetical protein
VFEVLARPTDQVLMFECVRDTSVGQFPGSHA